MFVLKGFLHDGFIIYKESKKASTVLWLVYEILSTESRNTLLLFCDKMSFLQVVCPVSYTPCQSLSTLEFNTPENMQTKPAFACLVNNSHNYCSCVKREASLRVHLRSGSILFKEELVFRVHGIFIL